MGLLLYNPRRLQSFNSIGMIFSKRRTSLRSPTIRIGMSSIKIVSDGPCGCDVCCDCSCSSCGSELLFGIETAIVGIIANKYDAEPEIDTLYFTTRLLSLRSCKAKITFLSSIPIAAVVKFDL
uniref:ORF1 n=1 Tax=Kallithea virus TaxID=1654582 RepID=A0A0F7KLM7_9VIRU|nr:ORF1 [Kallithea virus]